MVKLVSSRRNRLYGPAGYKELFETSNAFVYVLATVLLLAGLIFLLPNHDIHLGLILVLVASISLFIVQLHDLYAHLAGIDFRFDLLRVDPQYLLVEFAVPVVSSLGSFLVFLGVLFLLLKSFKVHALRLLVAGPILWFIASIHNAFQTYERTGLQLQVYERAVTVSFLVGSTLLLAGSFLGIPQWPSSVVDKVQLISIWLGVIGSAYYVLGGIVEVMRVMEMQKIEGGGGSVEFLRGGAQEMLQRRTESTEPFLEGSAKQREDEIEAPRPLYKDVAAGSPDRLY